MAEQQHEEHEEELFVATHMESALAVQSADVWLLDSGGTNHMSPNLEIFRNLDKARATKVKVGNGELLEVKGKGMAAIKTISGIKLLENVLYVPEIEHNLLSVGQLVDTGFSVHFEDGLCVVKNSNGVDLLTIAMKNRSFFLYLNESSNVAYTSVVKNSSLMHKRHGHCSYSTLREITRHGLIEDMPYVTQADCICRVCE